MANKRNHFYFVSVSTISSIPLIRFIVDALGENSKITFIETQIKKANSYFEKKKYVKMRPLMVYEDYDTYHENLGKNGLWKYFKLIYSLIKILFDKHSTIYTADYQVLALVAILKKVFPLKQQIVYHQFEVINKLKLGGIANLMHNVFLRNMAEIDLFIFPEINRMNYFLEEKNIKKNKLFLFPNTTSLSENTMETSGILNLPKEEKVCLHVGTIGGINHYFNELLNAINRLQGQKITFVFVGRLSNEVKQVLEKQSLDNLIVLSAIPHEQLRELYLKADLGIILYKGPGINYEFCAPNKLYEFWSYGVPVLGHKLEGMKPIFKSKLQGKLLDFNNVENIVNFLLELSFNEEDSLNLKNYFEKNLAVELYLEKLKSILTEKELYVCE